MDKEKLIHQLFIGKVADEIGLEKTTELLKEAKEVFKDLNVDSIIVNVNTQVEILNSTLDELMTGFDTKEDRMDFILDICNTYKKKAKEYARKKTTSRFQERLEEMKKMKDSLK